MLRKAEWEIYPSTHLGDLSHGAIQKVQFVATSCPLGEPYNYKKAMCTDQVDLPGHLVEFLRELADHYNSKIDKAKRALGEKSKAKKKKDATESKIEEMKAARAIWFPRCLIHQ